MNDDRWGYNRLRLRGLSPDGLVKSKTGDNWLLVITIRVMIGVLIRVGTDIPFH